MRLGIFGGTFDPVHYGHLLLAECCREQCQLDQVWFMPADIPPHKQERPLTPGRQRVEMLELAIGGHEAFSVSRLELERGGVSYTVDTLAQIHEQDPSRELYLLLGADSVLDLPHWKEPGRICELANLAMVGRVGQAMGELAAAAQQSLAKQTSDLRLRQVEMPLIELSSSDLRQRAASRGSLRYRTPRAVEKYIESAGLYRAATE
jgi:nicotinate-nucleotide adenylyltransferase